ncbi:hypothetical protein EYF80_058496 [Liparis tanakae]|uniref:Uncharacterized protein n=1 Tax=Liparis tanakae TaxID=230148 RepID=A0A4Z2ESU7_9TELE|nr:hypothetical protein EYF80_058496 [Liparis tanakae]
MAQNAIYRHVGRKLQHCGVMALQLFASFLSQSTEGPQKTQQVETHREAFRLIAALKEQNAYSLK